MHEAARPDLDTLLAHRNFVRRVASRLLADESDVDEVEQRTWLSSLGALVQAPRDARAWLYRVARNHSLNLMRSRSRARSRRNELAVHVFLAASEMEVARAAGEGGRRRAVADARRDHPLSSATSRESGRPRTRPARLGVVRARERVTHEG